MIVLMRLKEMNMNMSGGKSALVIDTPKNCHCCIFSYQYDYENEYDGYCRLYKNYKIINIMIMTAN